MNGSLGGYVRMVSFFGIYALALAVPFIHGVCR